MILRSQAREILEGLIITSSVRYIIITCLAVVFVSVLAASLGIKVLSSSSSKHFEYHLQRVFSLSARWSRSPEHMAFLQHFSSVLRLSLRLMAQTNVISNPKHMAFLVHLLHFWPIQENISFSLDRTRRRPPHTRVRMRCRHLRERSGEENAPEFHSNGLNAVYVKASSDAGD